MPWPFDGSILGGPTEAGSVKVTQQVLVLVSIVWTLLSFKRTPVIPPFPPAGGYLGSGPVASG